MPVDVVLPPSRFTLGISPSVGTGTCLQAVKATQTSSHAYILYTIRWERVSDKRLIVVACKTCLRIFFKALFIMVKK